MKRIFSVLLCVTMLLSVCSLFASAQDELSVWVGGVEVTDSNSRDVLGDGTVSYDKAKNILHLDGAEIGRTYNGTKTYDAGIFSSGSLEISVDGDSSIALTQDSSCGILTNEELKISGIGKLTVEAVSHGIYSFGTLTLKNARVDASATYFPIISVDGDLVISGSKVHSVAFSSEDEGYGIASFNGDVLIDSSNVFAMGKFGLVAQEGGKINVKTSTLVCVGNVQAVYSENGLFAIQNVFLGTPHLAIDRLGFAKVEFAPLVNTRLCRFFCLNPTSSEFLNSLSLWIARAKVIYELVDQMR